MTRHHHRTLSGVLTATIAAALLIPSATPIEGAITTGFTPSSQRELAPGIWHAKGTMRTTGGRLQAVQVATIDPTDPHVLVRPLLSNDRVIRLERPSLNADRHSVPGMLAVVATNGDMSVRGAYGAYAGPHSLHVQDGEVMVAPECSRPTLGVDTAGGVRIDDVRVRTRAWMSLPGEGPTLDDYLRVRGINTPRVGSEIILYTPRFGPNTMTGDGGTEVVLQAEGKIAPFGFKHAKVLAVRAGQGSTPLRQGQVVLSGSGEFSTQLRRLDVGDRLYLETVVLRTVRDRCGQSAVEDRDWVDVVAAQGGNWEVLDDGLIAAPTATEYAAGSQAHPRTSVGITADGRILMVVVDGRQPGYSIGVTLREMGALMRSLGAVDAFNLDGGGSTIMAVRRPGAAHITVSDRPSDGSERSLTQAFTIFSVDPPA